MAEHQHQHEHQHRDGQAADHGPHAETSEEVAAFWDDLYRQREQVWSGKVNAALVREVADLAPGTALDLGCGEGGDAIWLAERGWTVVAVDVSTEALARGPRHAAAAGPAVARRISWARHDLTESFPAGTYDLVSAQFLQSPVTFDRTTVLRRAAGAVAPGGRLVVVGHAEVPAWSEHRPDPALLPSAEAVLASLALDRSWTVETCEPWTRPATGPDGQAGSLVDSIVRVRRSAGSADLDIET